MSKYTPRVLVVVLAASLLAALPSTAQQNQASLPAGTGKDLVQAACTRCHGLNQITGSTGYTRERWQDLFSTMVKLSEAEAAAIASYLAGAFPPKNDRAPVLVPGNVQIKFQEWIVPTLGSRARDPIEAPDGSIWWVGMWASVAGRLDPRTGEMKEFQLPRAARPHSIVPDPAGNIWYTGNGNATIGKLDPRTGGVTEFKTQARDPHSAVWHPNGNLYFTAQGARTIGRLNPRTGEIKEVLTDANAYGIKVDSKGTVWVAHTGSHKIGAVDPVTMAIRYYELPDRASRIRRLDISSDDMIWFGNSALGRIGRLDPTTGEVKEWATPSGPRSHPYALAVVNDVVWFNESNQRPDALVQFDPATEKFQSWAIPSGYGIVRNMWATRGGGLLIHQTSSNRIGLVTGAGGKTTMGR
ncbi:MAG: cytochrome C [Gemmatimonadetes bacterium]|nr:cytochrome C [Gemmatimonadota bacterium]